MVTVTTSPAFSQWGGVRAKPTPCGVPVSITVAGQQRGAAAEELHQPRHVKDHVVGVPVLEHFGADFRFNRQGVGVGDFVGRDQPRAERGESVEGFCPAPLAATPLALPVAGANVVGAGVAQHVLERPIARDVLASPADHYGQFAFIIDLIAAKVTRQYDRVAGVLQRGGGLHKEHWKLRNRRLALGGMAAVVQADAHDVHRH